MSAELSERLRKLIDSIARQQCKEFRIETEPGTSKGDNTLGNITKVKVEGVGKCLDLIMKTATEKEDFRKIAPIHEIYVREVYFYQNIVPAFQSLLKEHQVDGVNLFPRFWAADLQFPEVLLMTDMKSNGYVMKNGIELLDLQHAELVMKSYGVLHGLSYALKALRPEVFTVLCENMAETFFANIDTRSEVYEEWKKIEYNKARKAFQSEDREALQRFDEFDRNGINKILHNFDRNQVDRHAVFNHGDSWMNNMLFYYGDALQECAPTQLCFLDFQLSRYASPANDLSNFIYTCTDQQLRDQHFDRLLHTYHDSMRAFLRKFRLHVDEFLNMGELNEQLRMHSNFGIHASIIVGHLMVSDWDEVPNLEDMKINQSNISNFAYVSKNESVYETRIRDVIVDCAKRGYI